MPSVLKQQRSGSFPDKTSRRAMDQWILRQRPPKNPTRSDRPYAFLIEEERMANGRVEKIGTYFLSNRECPFRCLMCDLWKNTTDDPVSPGAIPQQVRWALPQLSGVKHVKLYNSGNFFDSKAIPRKDLPEIAALLSPFETVIIENHPRLAGQHCLDFRDQLAGKLECAMGLETVHDGVLHKLNKRMTLSDFACATDYLVKNDIAVRAFILLRPPFLDEDEGIEWAMRSLDFAFDIGVECCAIIPTRLGNGALDALAAQGHFAEPKLASLEQVLAYGIGLQKGRVFADLWDLQRFASCPACFKTRAARLQKMNETQMLLPEISCECL